MDLSDLKGHLLRVVNDMVSKLTGLPLKEEPPVQFLFSGWSWRKNDFVSWVLHFDPRISRFTHRPIRGWAGPANEKRFSFIGDHYDEFHAELVKALRKSNKLEHGGFNMEPFQVIRDLLRSGKYDDIGGAPQLIKIYRHSNTTPHAIYWPNKQSGRLSFMGRPLLEYEAAQYPLLDPDTLKVETRTL